MDFKYQKGIIPKIGVVWNAEDEVDRIRGLRARIDSGLRASIDRLKAGKSGGMGEDPTTQQRSTSVQAYWCSGFKKQVDAEPATVGSCAAIAPQMNAKMINVIAALPASNMNLTSLDQAVKIRVMALLHFGNA